MSRKQNFLDNQSSDVATSWVPSIGGEIMYTLEGDFGGGTVTIELSNDGVTPLTQDPELIFAGPVPPFRLALPQGIFTRVVLSGSTAPSVSVVAYGIVV